MTYTILLYYKYVSIDNPEAFRDEQRGLCEELNLKGRIIVATEGINGTLEGSTEDVLSYIKTMQKDQRFADVDFKTSPGIGTAFPKLSVKVRPEIVTSKLGKDVNPAKETAPHLDPEDLHRWYEEGKDFVVVDMRNDYEFKSGRFKNSVEPGLRNFRDLSEKVKEIDNLKDKTVVTVCTGGVRCEKASAFLQKEGFKEVYQLNGGIHRYVEKYPGEHFEGGLYVFDGRVVMDTAPEEKRVIVGRCEYCDDEAEDYYDDRSEFPTQILVCDECAKTRSFLRPAKRLIVEK